MVMRLLPSGRAAQKVRPGYFIRDYLQTTGQASIAELHQAYTDTLRPRNPITGRRDFALAVKRKRRYAHEKRPGRYQGMRYSSFLTYANRLIRAGALEEIGRRPVQLPLGAKEEVIVALGPNAADDAIWHNVVKALGWQKP